MKKMLIPNDKLNHSLASRKACGKGEDPAAFDESLVNVSVAADNNGVYLEAWSFAEEPGRPQVLTGKNPNGVKSMRVGGSKGNGLLGC